MHVLVRLQTKTTEFSFSFSYIEYHIIDAVQRPNDPKCYTPLLKPYCIYIMLCMCLYACIYVFLFAYACIHMVRMYYVYL
jgi:hypothetical protein